MPADPEGEHFGTRAHDDETVDFVVISTGAGGALCMPGGRKVASRSWACGEP